MNELNSGTLEIIAKTLLPLVCSIYSSHKACRVGLGFHTQKQESSKADLFNYKFNFSPLYYLGKAQQLESTQFDHFAH
jgi:hypothetical protein